MTNKKILLIFFIFSFLFFHSIGQARAQSLSLSLWPPLLEVMIQPGRAVTQVYKLTNNSDRELSLTPFIFPFEPKGEDGQVSVNTKSKKQNTFFSFQTREKFGEPFLIKTGQTRELVLKISLPKNTAEKDYYYTLIFSSEEMPFASRAEGGLASSTSQIGSHILITVSQLGKPNLLGRIINFSAPKISDSFSPVNFTLVLENWGKNLWKPFGKITTKGLLGQKEELRVREQNVLAHSSRQLSLAPFKPSFPLGPFKADLEITLNEEGPKLSSSMTFWYLPYKAISIILGLAFFIIAVKKVRKITKTKPLTSNSDLVSN